MVQGLPARVIIALYFLLRFYFVIQFSFNYFPEWILLFLFFWISQIVDFIIFGK